jgi:nucleoside-diphosphate-sugar epimerase
MTGRQKYFITGGGGYIGNWLVKKLTDRGHELHILARDPEKMGHLASANTKIFKGDITDPASLRKAMEGCDGVFHLAAYAKVWAKDPATYFQLNVTATNYILDAARELGIKRTVVTSTGGVFGASGIEPIHEMSVRNYDFFNEYESSKAYSELRIKDYVIDGMDIVIVSPTRVYGPYLRGKSESITLMIEKFVKGSWRLIPGDGKKEGNYVYVEDVAEGHILAMEQGRKGHTYLLGGSNHDYLDFFNTLKKITGIKRRMIHLPDSLQMTFARLQMMKTWFGKEPMITPKWIAKGKYHWRVNAEKAQNELGLKVTGFEEGLRKTVNWLNEKKAE